MGVIPRSQTEKNIKANIDGAFDWDLSESLKVPLPYYLVYQAYLGEFLEILQGDLSSPFLTSLVHNCNRTLSHRLKP